MKLLKSGTVVIVITLCALSILLYGCGQETPNPTVTPTPVQTPAPTPVPTPEPTPRPVVTIRSIFPGEESTGIDAVLEELNKKLDEDILTRLELGWTDAEQYGESIKAAVAAGDIDFLWCDSDELAEYTADALLAPIDAPMSEFGQAIYDNIDNMLFDTMKIDGKLMGIPSSGNMPLCDTGNVLTIREDLRLKYGLPKLDSITNMELYFKTIKEKEPDIKPLFGDNIATVIMKAFGPEDILDGTGRSVAIIVNSDNTVTCMGIQDAPSFKGAVTKVREWYAAGLLPKDMLVIGDTVEKLTSGAAAATGGEALLAIEQQAALSEKVPDAALSDQPVFSSTKYISGNGGNALCLTACSDNPGPVVKFWAWILTNQSNYDLFCYGIEGSQYEIDGDRIAMLNSSYSAFPATVFNNMNYSRFPIGASDDYIYTLKHWNDGAKLSPLLGFVFDPAKVKNEVAKVKAVYAIYGPALSTGSANTAALLAELTVKMKAAGQEKIIAEAQAQIDSYLSAHK